MCGRFFWRCSTKRVWVALIGSLTTDPLAGVLAGTTGCGAPVVAVVLLSVSLLTEVISVISLSERARVLNPPRVFVGEAGGVSLQHLKGAGRGRAHSRRSSSCPCCRRRS